MVYDSTLCLTRVAIIKKAKQKTTNVGENVEKLQLCTLLVGI